ncbi:MAG: hypothetical protein HY445_01270 [Candidatus Niyogibacteria bacterium]|nr:hypothetical protein [Candidatus Niyogibacteria bacterium]
MAYDNNQGGGGYPPRQMFKGDWKCSKCGADIKELPFQPAPDRMDQLQCRDCYKKDRPTRRRF